MFSHMFLLFQLLRLVFSQNCYLPVSQPKYFVHAPPFFWYRTRGFLISSHKNPRADTFLRQPSYEVQPKQEITKDTQLVKKKVIVACHMTVFSLTFRSKAIVRPFSQRKLRSGSFNLRRVVVLRYCSCCVRQYSPFPELPSHMASSQTKSSRSLYFKRDGSLRTQILVNQKMKFLVEDTWNLAFAEPPSRLPWSSSFLSHVPLFLATDQPCRTQRLPRTCPCMQLVGT